MKAYVLQAIGGPEVLKLVDIAIPEVGVNDVRVKVRAVGVNPIDCKLRRTGALGVKAGTVLGFDVAGVIEEVGIGVKDFKEGDEVYYSPGFGRPGAYAEYQVSDAGLVAHKPKGLSFVEAASLPLAGMTAWDGVVTRGQVGLGQTVLITAANGGVGSLAVQICKAAGAYVYATASSRSLEFVQQLGADRVLNYQTEDWVQIIAGEVPVTGGGLDLVYDCVGQDVVSKSIPLIKLGWEGNEGGRIVTIVNPTGNLAEAYRKNITIHYEFLQRRRETLDKLRTLVERKQLRPLIDSVLSWHEVAEAHRRLELGGVKGKIVLEVGR